MRRARSAKVSLRLYPEQDKFLLTEAQRLGLSKNSVVSLVVNKAMEHRAQKVKLQR